MRKFKESVDLNAQIVVKDQNKNSYNLLIEGTYYPEIKGSRDSMGVPEEPDEPASFDYNCYIEGQEDLTYDELIDLITYSEEELHDKIVEALEIELDDLLDYQSYSFL